MAIKSLMDSLPVLRGKMDIISEAPSEVEILRAREEESEDGAICVVKVAVKIHKVWQLRFVPVLYGEDPEGVREKILNIVIYLKEGTRK